MSGSAQDTKGAVKGGGSAWAEVQKPQFAQNVQGTEKFVGAEPEVRRAERN